MKNNFWDGILIGFAASSLILSVGLVLGVNAGCIPAIFTVFAWIAIVRSTNCETH